jgi:hypothetical protein
VGKAARPAGEPCFDEGVEAFGRVEGGRDGQAAALEAAGARLQFPDDPELLAEPVILDGRQVDEVLRGG